MCRGAVVALQSAPWLDLALVRSSQAKVGVVAAAIAGGMATATIMAVAAGGTGFPTGIAERLDERRFVTASESGQNVSRWRNKF
jgi:hypothetical protein